MQLEIYAPIYISRGLHIYSNSTAKFAVGSFTISTTVVLKGHTAHVP